jgi:hypothetical protein
MDSRFADPRQGASKVEVCFEGFRLSVELIEGFANLDS